MTTPQINSASYEVGYGKPPRRTQFKTGQSGNPGGGPRGQPAERLKELALYEAYRTVIVKEDGRAVPMSPIQAVLRSQIESAASGNVRAQCAILAMIQQVEWENVVDAEFTALRLRANDDDAAGDDAAEDDHVDDAAADDENVEPAPQAAYEIDADVESQQEEREPAAAQPSSAYRVPQPENGAARPAKSLPPAAEARVSKGAVLRDATPKATRPEGAAGARRSQRQPGTRRRTRQRHPAAVGRDAHAPALGCVRRKN